MASGPRIRRFLWQDIERLTFLFNEVNGISDTEKRHDVGYMRELLSQPSCRPEKNCFLAESDGGPVGFAIVHPELPIGRAVISGGVQESHRRQGLGRELLKTCIEHARRLGAAVLHVEAPSNRAGAECMLGSEGFQPVKTYWQMRWATGEVPSMALPEGFVRRPFVLDRDEEELTKLQNAAFSRNWGFCPNTVEEIRDRVRLSRGHPDGIIVALDGDRPAAYNWTMISSNSAASTGWIAMTGVHPDYRARGLGKAVVVAGMEYLSAKGVDGVELEVDAENMPARKLYLALGFRKLNETRWYEKRLKT